MQPLPYFDDNVIAKGIWVVISFWSPTCGLKSDSEDALGHSMMWKVHICCIIFFIMTQINFIIVFLTKLHNEVIVILMVLTGKASLYPRRVYSSNKCGSEDSGATPASSLLQRPLVVSCHALPSHPSRLGVEEQGGRREGSGITRISMHRPTYNSPCCKRDTREGQGSGESDSVSLGSQEGGRENEESEDYRLRQPVCVDMLT